MRGPALATLSLSLCLAGCVTPAGSITTCGAVQLDHPLVVLEQHFGEASGLGRVDEGGCFLEVPDASLSGTGIFAAAGERLFFVDQTQGVLDPIDTKTLGLAGIPSRCSRRGKSPRSPTRTAPTSTPTAGSGSRASGWDRWR